MGDCSYCGGRAGFFKSVHDDCAAFAQEQVRRAAALQTPSSPAPGSHQISNRALAEAQIEGWRQAVEQALDDNLISQDELKRLTEYLDRAGLTDLARSTSAWNALVKGVVLRELADGATPKRFEAEGLPLNIPITDTMVWAWRNARYFEDRTRRSYEGRSQGISVRVASGVYMRLGQFKGNPVETVERTHVDTGWLVATRYHLWFAGPAKSLKIPWKKILTVHPYSDGFGIHLDTASAKPQTFVSGDGWFSSNLVTMLASR